MKSYKIYLFRHGLTKGNLNAQYIGHTDLPLTSASVEELKKINVNTPYPQVDAVFTSPLRRAVSSAEIMFPTHKPIIINEFIEYNFGDFEGKTADELKNNEKFHEWISGDIKSRTPNGESNAEFTHRICTAFEKIVSSMISTGIETTAIVCHAGVLMTILSCYGLPEAPMAEWRMDAGYGFELKIDPALWMRANKAEVYDTAPEKMKTD